MKARLKKALLDYYDELEDEDPNRPEKEKIKIVQKLLKEEWGEGGDRGYGIFEEDYEFDYPMLVIERIDEVDAYDGDVEAAQQAKKDGIKIIPCKEYPYRTYPFNAYRFLDTPENRVALQKNIEAFIDEEEEED